MTKEEIQSIKQTIENERKKDYKEALEKILEIIKEYEDTFNDKLTVFINEDEYKGIYTAHYKIRQSIEFTIDGLVE